LQFFFFWLCVSIFPLGHCVVTELGIIGILLILIYAPYSPAKNIYAAY
jgi:hypothetical protein